MELKDFLKILAHHDGSDLYLTAEAPPVGKFEGTLKPLENIKLNKDRIKDIAYSLMDEDQQKTFEQIHEMNLAISEPGIGRFRVNIFKQRNSFALVIRNIKIDIPNVDKLGLPPILKKTIMEKRGLILIIGGTGSGKSTSLAALIDYRNSNASGHIITIEDPIEYIHPHKKSLVNQREVGVDTLTYEDALKNTLRQAPDVILIDEIRSRETMEHALNFSESGLLCLSTLNANNSHQALDRIINFFPEERRNQLLLDLSLNLKAFVSQRLVPTIDGKRTAAIEVLLGTQLIRDLIHKGDIHGIKDAMEKSENTGMQTFDSHLLRLFKEGIISLDEALLNSDSPNNLKLKINLSPGLGSATPDISTNTSKSDLVGGLSLQAIHKDEGADESVK
jgi:twitching motility protein PilU